MNTSNLIKVQEMATILNVPVSWIYQRTCQGPDKIPHVKVGKYVRFNPDDVIEFFKNHGSSRTGIK